MKTPKNWKPRRLPVLTAGKRYSGYVGVVDGEPNTYQDAGYAGVPHADIITMTAQAPGAAPTGMATLPRAVFHEFVRWYDTGQMTAQKKG